ncbi:MAG: hypothetical protein IKO52_03665 [Clostridia bacterium]|nr:hypothetical protein [Clostridia bacterium]
MENNKKQLIDEEVEKVAGGHNPSPNQNKPNGVKTGAPNGAGGIKNGVDNASNSVKDAVDKIVPRNVRR